MIEPCSPWNKRGEEPVLREILVHIAVVSAVRTICTKPGKPDPPEIPPEIMRIEVLTRDRRA